MDTTKLMESLFRWRKPIKVNDVTLYMRVVSDSVIEDARKAALIESRRLRRALRDPATDEYLIYLDGVVDLTNQELINGILAMGSRDVARDYVATNPRPVLPQLGDFPTQEQQEEQEAAKEEREQAYFEALQAHITTWQTDYNRALEQMPREQLESIYKKHRIDRICEDEFTRSFEEYVVAMAVYTDDTYKKRAFTVEDYRELPTRVKETLRDEYNNISVPMEDVKN